MIGLPGDKIQMIEGRLYINGEVVPREPIAAGARPKISTAARRAVPTYKETLPGGVKHTIIEIEGDSRLLRQYRRLSKCRRATIS